jgi:hypothetical protein
MRPGLPASAIASTPLTPNVRFRGMPKARCQAWPLAGSIPFSARAENCSHAMKFLQTARESVLPQFPASNFRWG